MLKVFDYKTSLGALDLSSVEILLLATIVEVAVRTVTFPIIWSGVFLSQATRVCLL